MKFMTKFLSSTLPIAFISLFILAGCHTTTLVVTGDVLRMDGIITSRTPTQMKKIFADHPNIKTILMGEVLGSIDDEANLEISTWIIDKKVTTRLNANGFIASGGVDFFIAGATRIIESGAQVGVHSWGDGRNITATDFPRGHENHLPYIEYYKKAGFSQQQAEDFYYFTIEAAPPEGVYFMTDAELVEYNIVTEPLK